MKESTEKTHFCSGLHWNKVLICWLVEEAQVNWQQLLTLFWLKRGRLRNRSNHFSHAVTFVAKAVTNSPVLHLFQCLILIAVGHKHPYIWMQAIIFVANRLQSLCGHWSCAESEHFTPLMLLCWVENDMRIYFLLLFVHYNIKFDHRCWAVLVYQRMCARVRVGLRFEGFREEDEAPPWCLQALIHELEFLFTGSVTRN